WGGNRRRRGDRSGRQTGGMAESRGFVDREREGRIVGRKPQSRAQRGRSHGRIRTTLVQHGPPELARNDPPEQRPLTKTRANGGGRSRPAGRRRPCCPWEPLARTSPRILRRRVFRWESPCREYRDAQRLKRSARALSASAEIACAPSNSMYRGFFPACSSTFASERDSSIGHTASRVPCASTNRRSRFGRSPRFSL